MDLAFAFEMFLFLTTCIGIVAFLYWEIVTKGLLERPRQAVTKVWERLFRK